MAMTHEVAILAGADGFRLDTWDRYEVSLSMTQPGTPWTVTLFRSRRAESAWDRVWRALRLGDPMAFSIDGAVQMNGAIEEVTDGSDPDQGDTLTVSGRDLSGPALRWDADPRVRLKGLTLEEAMQRLFAPLGIAVRVGEDVDSTREVQLGTARNRRARRSTRPRRHPVDLSRPQPGEKVWQVADALCRRFGYMLWVAPHPEQGLSVAVDVPAYTDAARFELRRRYHPDRAPGEERYTDDTNILRATRRVSVRDVPTEVTVYTGSARGASLSSRSTQTLLNAGMFDETVNGGVRINTALQHPMHIRAQRARTPAAALQTAQRAINDAMRGFRTYTCAVQGHGQRQRDGRVRLYAVNTMARVIDDGRSMDEPMLIQDLTFRGDAEAGSLTELTLGPVGAIVLTPETP